MEHPEVSGPGTRLGLGRRRVRAVVVSLIVLSAAAVFAGTLLAGHAARAGGSPGVSGTVLAKGNSAGLGRFETLGATDVIVRRIVIGPGASTGWHYHSGGAVRDLPDPGR